MIEWSVEPRKLSELKAYEKNPRRITEKGLNDLIKSLELFGENRRSSGFASG
jgi:hypothetical protein